MKEQALLKWTQPLVDWLPALDSYRWQLAVVVLLFATALLALVARRVLHAMARSLERTRPVWDDQLLEAVSRPFQVLIWVFGITLSMQLSAPYLAEISDGLAPKIRSLSLIVLLAWTVIRFIARVEESVLQRNPTLDRTTADAICKLLRLIVLVLAGLMLLQGLGYSVSGILAFGGIGGIAVGFAAKDLLANFFGGLMIYLDRPFKVGDWVRSPDKNIEGVVEQIGWRLTVIRTFDKRPLYVPNATFNSIALENPSRMTNRRIFEYVGVRYDDAAAIPGIVDKIRDMLVTHPEIDADNTLFVHLNRFGPSSLDIMVYTFTRTTDWGRYLAVREDVMVKIIDIVDAAGAEIAFPTTTVHLAAGEIEPAHVVAQPQG